MGAVGNRAYGHAAASPARLQTALRRNNLNTRQDQAILPYDRERTTLSVGCARLSATKLLPYDKGELLAGRRAFQARTDTDPALRQGRTTLSVGCARLSATKLLSYDLPVGAVVNRAYRHEGCIARAVGNRAYGHAAASPSAVGNRAYGHAAASPARLETAPTKA